MKYNYIINAPKYRRTSGGIRTLYNLNDILNKEGYSCKIVIIGEDYVCGADEIVIYPEIVKGNPLKSKKVVRYILNRPGLIGGDLTYDESELLYAYCESLSQYSHGRILTVPIIEEFFYNKNLKRNKDVFYVGKCKHSNRIKETEGLVEITREFPEAREDLAELLNTTNTFYTYDNFTALTLEAELCGCVVKIVDEYGRVQDRYEDAAKFFDEFNKQFKEFIKITQKWGEVIWNYVRNALKVV